MITAYYRPKTLEDALELLTRSDGLYLPIGGGVNLSQMPERTFSVVDLQSLGLNQVVAEGQFLQIGATTTLQALSDCENLQNGVNVSLQLEANFNLRQQATVAGSLVSADGRSTFGVTMLALDASLHWLPGGLDQTLGDWFALRQPPHDTKLITQIQTPLNAGLLFDSVGRSPGDLPVICVAVAKWPSGRTRIALGGFGDAPILALDSPEPGGAEAAVIDALSRSGDEWASADYRQEAGAKMVTRLLNHFLTV